MFLSKRLVQEYQNEYKRKYGEDISPKDAERELLNLKDLVCLIIEARRQRRGN